MKMKEKENAKEYISRVDSAVSDLAVLNEKVSVNSWLFILANGLRPEFVVTRKGVLFMETGYGSIIEVKNKILQEETVNGIGKLDTANIKDKIVEIAHAAFDGNCDYCNRKGHKKSECRKLKKDQEAKAKTSRAKYWCDICYKEGHSTDYCSLNPTNQPNAKGKKGKGKGTKGKGKGGKGKNVKGGRGQGHFPANYIPEVAQYAKENWNSTENWDLQE